MSGVVIYAYLDLMVEKNATDLYLTVGTPPMLRINGDMSPVGNDPLQRDNIDEILSELLTSRQRREFEANMELNVAYDIGRNGRFRINVLRQRQQSALVIRRISTEIPSFDQLQLPPIMKKLSLEKRGMILICGVTSSGKSTTLTAMADYRNQNEGGHIITIEDPIEYYHEHKKGIVTQREIGIDTAGYSVALKNALRQKPDVIMVGEIRDSEVMEQTITAAETGHLCVATIHTNNASQAIERVVNFFPEERQKQVRIALSLNLRAIVAQRLVRHVNGGLVVAVEVLLNEALIKDLILKGETTKIHEIMESNNAAGMVTFDQSLYGLFTAGKISEETALAEADLSADMKIRIQQHKFGSRKDGMTSIDTSRLSL